MNREHEPIVPLSEQTGDSQKEKEKPSFGANVSIDNQWIRHAQKMSANISNAEGGTSTASISEKGQEQAFELGTTIAASEQGAKGYVSSSARTTETLDQFLKGYQEYNPDTPIRGKKIREELTLEFPDDFWKLYDDKFSAEKNRILTERNVTPEQFKDLTPDEQEKVAETAEEPVLREWVEDPKSELAKLFPPREQAARFASLFNRRHERLARKLYSGSDINLLHLTHKTITEPFLVSGVLTRKSDGERITSLSQIGGSLETLGNWESKVITDDQGKSEVSIFIRGEEFQIDSEILQALVAEDLERRKAKNIQ